MKYVRVQVLVQESMQAAADGRDATLFLTVLEHGSQGVTGSGGNIIKERSP